VKGFKCCIPNAMDGTVVGMLWNCSEVGGKVRSLCEEEVLTVKMETVILIGKGQIQSDTLCVLSICINNKTFFIADALFLERSS